MSSTVMDTSSRIFVKGLPPSITESDFKKHFSFQGHDTTETRLFASRRIGYVGYKSADEAQKAVKYFNKTFMRMSRIGVELARPPKESKTPTAKLDNQEASTTPSSQSTKQTAPKQDRDGDAKLKEFLDVMKPGQKKRTWENDVPLEIEPAGQKIEEVAEDSEYEDVPRKAKKQKLASEQDTTQPRPEQEIAEDAQTAKLDHDNLDEDAEANDDPVTDADWARSRTSRLLGLLDDEEVQEQQTTNTALPITQDDASPDEQGEEEGHTVEAGAAEVTSDADATLQAIRSTMRLFLRNLSYNLQDEDLEAEFAQFGHIEEVHVSVSKKTGSGKGFAYIQFNDPDAAEAAYKAKDGQIFQGRILHILPATAKPEDKLNDFELSKLPLKKQQQIQRKRDAGSTQFNWNTLYMNPDAVVSSVAAQFGISKSDVLDPTSSDAAVKQAHAETHVIQETKSFFKSHGVDLDSFKKSQRGDTAILIKNIPFDASKEELRRLFEEHGDVTKFLMPPSGVIAIVEMANAAQAKSAFGALAYKRFKSSMLFLEKAPKDVFNAGVTPTVSQDTAIAGKVSTTDLKNTDSDLQVRDLPGTATLFVRNLNFATTTAQLTETFKPLTGFLTARVKTKTDAKKPGQTLSMGFGFVEFRSAADAQAALNTMDSYTLHGHKLQVRASQRSGDAAEEHRKAKQAKREAGQRTKIIIKNLPFETSKKDVRALFSAYGQLRSIRVPKKMDRAARGFAFADFTTPKEAQSAMDALRDTHLLGRRLVLDFADEEPADAEAEIERMAAKVESQANAVAIQKLTGGGRKKFSTNQQDDEDI